MKEYMLPYFGPVLLDALEEYYEAHLELDNNQIDMDLNFESETIPSQKLQTVEEFIQNIKIHVQKNKEHIEADYNKEGGTVKSYCEHHSDLFPERADEKNLLDELHLVRIGFYPEDDDRFAVFDYSIGRDLTDYLIVVCLNEKGELSDITMES